MSEVYCPRLVYFDRVLHAQPVLAFSKKKAKSYMRNMCVKSSAAKTLFTIRQNLSAPKNCFFVQLVSGELQLQGVVDCIIKTAKGEYIPVEYKDMNSNFRS